MPLCCNSARANLRYLCRSRTPHYPSIAYCASASLTSTNIQEITVSCQLPRSWTGIAVGPAGPILRGPEPGLKSLQASSDKLCFGSGQARPAWPMLDLIELVIHWLIGCFIIRLSLVLFYLILIHALENVLNFHHGRM
jgi:hypothetical protein